MQMFWQMFWNGREAEKKYIVMPMLYPMGTATFAIACKFCKNMGTDKCRPCKEERVSGFELIPYKEELD